MPLFLTEVSTTSGEEEKRTSVRGNKTTEMSLEQMIEITLGMKRADGRSNLVLDKEGIFKNKTFRETEKPALHSGAEAQ
jgi:hypothetical protein